VPASDSGAGVAPEWQRHDIGATAIAAVAVIAATSPPLRAYERVFDTQAKDIAEGLLVETGAAPIASSPTEALPSACRCLDQRPPRPLMRALFIRVADPAARSNG